MCSRAPFPPAVTGTEVVGHPQVSHGDRKGSAGGGGTPPQRRDPGSQGRCGFLTSAPCLCVGCLAVGTLRCERGRARSRALSSGCSPVTVAAGREDREGQGHGSRAWVHVPILLSCSETSDSRWVVASSGLLLRQIPGQQLRSEVATAANEVGRIWWETRFKLKGLLVLLSLCGWTAWSRDVVPTGGDTVSSGAFSFWPGADSGVPWRRTVTACCVKNVAAW